MGPRISYGPRRVPADSDIEVVREADYTESRAEYGEVLCEIGEVNLPTASELRP